MDSAVINMPFEMAMGDFLSRRQFYNRAQDVWRRLQAAEAELALLKSCDSTPNPSVATIHSLAQNVIAEGGDSWFGPGQLFDEDGNRIPEAEENLILAASPKALIGLSG